MSLPPAETIKWLALLAAALLLTSFGTTFPNRFNQQRSPRSHNSFRLFNECLARSQLALFNYFLAFGITAPLPNHPYVKYWMMPVEVMAAYFYVTNIAASVELDLRLKESHQCVGTPEVALREDVKTTTSKMCTVKIRPWDFIKMSARYVVSILILAGLAIYFAFVAGT
jgi:hypothetical protein